MAQTPEERRANARESSRRWRERNPEKVREQYEQQRGYQREYQRAWRARNPERSRAIQLRSRDRNRDRLREQRRAWRDQNRDKVREQERVRRMLDPGRNQHGRWIKEDRAVMWAMQDGNCYLCGELWTQSA